MIRLKICSGREDESCNEKELIKDKEGEGIKMLLVMDRAYESDEMRSLGRECHRNQTGNSYGNMRSNYRKRGC